MHLWQKRARDCEFCSTQHAHQTSIIDVVKASCRIAVACCSSPSLTDGSLGRSSPHRLQRQPMSKLSRIDPESAACWRWIDRPVNGEGKRQANERHLPPRNFALTRKENAMEYATRGNTGLLVSKLCFGTMTFGDGRGLFKAVSAVGQAGADELVRTSIDGGINFFDTADNYTAGESEKILGQSLKNLNIPWRDVVIATKVYSRVGPGRNDVGAALSHLARRGSLAAPCRLAKSLNLLNPSLAVRRVVSSRNG
jgi:Aldo/keto reductase family